jgi:hypothetical protein
MRKTQKKTAQGREVNAFRSRYGVLPLEYMLKVLNNDKLPMRLRCNMAEAAAPFLHQKLKAIAIDDDVGGPKKHNLDLTKLSKEELDELDQILAKST